jgi:hypothetical protein
MLALVLLQAVAGPVLPAAPRPASDRPCPADTSTDEVVVCGRRDNEQFRLRPLAEGPEAWRVPRAQLKVGDAALAAETEAASVGGFQSNRLMLRLKLPF